MLLIHQAGSVKIGEVVRYTLTYTPSNDRVLPTPSHLSLRVKNTSAIPLRAAWVHGPYALHISAYPSTFNPHCKVEDPQKDGMPEFEPMVKAGGSFTAKLLVPEAIRETGADLGKRRHSVQSRQSEAAEEAGSVTWIVEIASQILFSNSASVGFEVLVGRDDRSLDMGFAAVAGYGHGTPGQIKEQPTAQERKAARKKGNLQTAGVYSKAIKLVVEDTETLWDKPALPSREEEKKPVRGSSDQSRRSTTDHDKKPRKRKNIHLVIVTHGLHSNLGADMLFLKESIDATVKQARLDAKKRKDEYRASQSANRDTPSSESENVQGTSRENESSTAPLSGGQEDLDNTGDDSDDEEETIVRGFPGNAVRTENGIQFLGKRLAKYILRFTYPDQPFLPIRKSLSRSITDSFKSDARIAKRDGKAAHQGSSIHLPSHPERRAEDLAYKFTSISFVGHSLGGLIQTYAIAYIHKHAPSFFTQIKPINFICMASPMLGLSNENPMYVKFALDFGLVGRTGQDLGLTWRPPTIAKGGWNAMIGGFGAVQKDKDADKEKEDPAAKPLLRILPTGPAHQILRLFRNRTVYSNVVNDGIVPLRTSCLLFLDWRGLGKVEKARRENGLIGTVAEWGWAELTGANASSITPNVRVESLGEDEEEDDEHVRQGEGETVPQPGEDETAQDGKMSLSRFSLEGDAPGASSRNSRSSSPSGQASRQNEKGMFDSLFSFFRPGTPERPKSPATSKKTTKALRRGQTVHHGEDELEDEVASGQEGTTSNPTMRPHIPHLHTGQVKHKRPKASRGDSLVDTQTGELQAPPRTSIFESAGDILHPPLPGKQWILDPSTRSRTIFHDRIYHPEDIPPPPVKRAGTRLTRSFSSEQLSKLTSSSKPVGQSSANSESSSTADTSSMKVEEKIARAYHRDLSWRKVLVRLEPDAHNNMIVRRMFANAYGWPVIKHLCDTHFADTYAATTRDEEEPARERAQPIDAPIDPEVGEEVKDQTTKEPPQRTNSEMREERDELKDLDKNINRAEGSYSSKMSKGSHLSRTDSAEWDESYFELSDGEDSDAVDERNLVSRLINPNLPAKKPTLKKERTASTASNKSTSVTPSSPFVEGHRGLAPLSPVSTHSTRSPPSTKSKASVMPTFDSADIDSPLLTKQFVQEPGPTITSPASPTSTAAIGLRKSIEGQVSPTKVRTPSSGVASTESGKVSV